jgi:hypothetical protein
MRVLQGAARGMCGVRMAHTRAGVSARVQANGARRLPADARRPSCDARARAHAHLDKLDLLLHVGVHRDLAQLGVGALAAVAPGGEEVCAGSAQAAQAAQRGMRLALHGGVRHVAALPASATDSPSPGWPRASLLVLQATPSVC